MKYETIKDLKSEHLRRSIGVTKEIFNNMVNILKQAHQEKHSKGGRNPKLSIENQLILILRFLQIRYS